MTFDPQLLRNMANAMEDDGYKIYPGVLRHAAEEIETLRQTWIRQRILFHVVPLDVSRDGQGK